MIELGIFWIGMALAVVALFPLFVYSFFNFVILERKSEGLVQDLECLNAFTIIKKRRDDLGGPNEIKQSMRTRYSFKRFSWPLSLLVFSNLICFSMLWDIARHRFAQSESVLLNFYTPKFLEAAELPMMAFVGVVIFNYCHILRRLYVWDLTSQVFWNALQRTWMVLAVASVLAASMSFVIPASTGTPELLPKWHAVFFAIGFIVNEVVLSLMDRARNRFQIQRLKVEELPLSLVQGINFWHEYRLEEEGVENVQNLATCDFFDLAMATRFNLRTLLDWTDQAILIHRMGKKATQLRDAGFISGAIDMAWGSPQNADGDLKLADQIAKTVETETIYVSTLMNSLYQDAQIHMLWDLWQSKLDARTQDKYQ